MPGHILVLYEIAEQASRVRSKKALKRFERWVKKIIERYQDALVERYAMAQLFRLKSQFAF